MGKIYEAISRAGAEAGQSRYPFPPAHVDSGEEEASQDLENHFNFMRYSMGASSIADHERKRREETTEAIDRRSVAHPAPAQEMFVDTARVDPHLVTFTNMNPVAAEQYNKLALSVISRSVERRIRRIMIASAQQGEGRTTISLNLACALARARQRVLVVDCDLLNPSVMTMLGLRCQVGIEEEFAGGLVPGTTAVRIQPFGFNVLPTARRVDNHVELLAAPGFWKLLQAFDADYD